MDGSGKAPPPNPCTSFIAPGWCAFRRIARFASDGEALMRGGIEDVGETLDHIE